MKQSDLIYALATHYAQLQTLYDNLWEAGETANKEGHTRKQLWLEDMAHAVTLAQGHITSALNQAIKGENK